MTKARHPVPPPIAYIWGSTADEREQHYPCDRYLPDCDAVLHRGIDVRARAATVFRWLCQLKVAPYSYDWLDNWGRRSPRKLTPGLEHLTLGEPVMTIFSLAEYQADRHVTLRMTHPGALQVFGDIALTYWISPIGAQASRITVRMRIRYPRRGIWKAMRWVLPWGDLFMMRKQLITIKLLSERSGAETSIEEQYHG